MSRLWIVLAVTALLLPPAAAVLFVKATSTTQDANVGGALFLIGGVVLGLALATVVVTTARRGCATSSRSEDPIATGKARS